MNASALRLSGMADLHSPALRLRHVIDIDIDIDR
jgi:hypothetical protein